MHYPVDEILTASREAFYVGDYDIKLVPLMPFPSAVTNFQTFLGGAFEIGNVQSVRIKESKMTLWARQNGTGRIQLAEPPLPVLQGVPRPHGAVLDLRKRPIPLVYDDALVKYLRYRGIR